MSSRNLMLKYLVFLPDENGSQWRAEAEGHDQTSTLRSMCCVEHRLQGGTHGSREIL